MCFWMCPINPQSYMSMPVWQGVRAGPQAASARPVASRPRGILKRASDVSLRRTVRSKLPLLNILDTCPHEQGYIMYPAPPARIGCDVAI